MKKRVSLHGGKSTTSRHNDRNFDVTKAEHIDSKKSCQNEYYMNMSALIVKKKIKTFEEYEKEFYKQYFSDYIKGQNDRNELRGQKSRNRSIEQYESNRRTRPREEIFKCGNYQDGYAPMAKIKKAHQIYCMWHDEMFGSNIILMTSALHADEEDSKQDGIHYHDMRAFVWKNEHGEYEFNQTKALQELGIQRPYPDKPSDRFNNELMTYTQMCREKYQEICLSLGLDIETKAKQKEYKNLPIEDYKKLMESEHKIKELTAMVSEKQKANDELQQKCDELQQNYDDLYQKRHEEFEKFKKATSLRQQEEQAATKATEQRQDEESKLKEIEEISLHKSRWMVATLKEKNESDEMAGYYKGLYEQRLQFEEQITFDDGESVKEYIDSEIQGESTLNNPNSIFNDQQEEYDLY